jgi:hypothetical protein
MRIISNYVYNVSPSKSLRISDLETNTAIHSPAEKFLEISQAGGKLEVEKLYNQLKSITIEAILGGWEGGSIDTGYLGYDQMLAMKWVGKNFFSTNNVQPIILYDEARKITYAEELSGGLARL